MKTLDKIKPGETVYIMRLESEGAIRRRLLDLGLTPKTKVLVRKVAPLGDPIELYLRSYELTIRAEDARRIIINEVNDEDSFNRQPKFREDHFI